jgi:hypothetical protein
MNVNVCKSWTYNKVQIKGQPSMLTGYVKNKITSGDTVMILVELFSGINKIDSSN